jgi:hypothetical protein
MRLYRRPGQTAANIRPAAAAYLLAVPRESLAIGGPQPSWTLPQARAACPHPGDVQNANFAPN